VRFSVQTFQGVGRHLPEALCRHFDVALLDLIAKAVPPGNFPHSLDQFLGDMVCHRFLPRVFEVAVFEKSLEPRFVVVKALFGLVDNLVFLGSEDLHTQQLSQPKDGFSQRDVYIFPVTRFPTAGAGLCADHMLENSTVLVTVGLDGEHLIVKVESREFGVLG
jgi:hypothetical protein